MSRHATDRALVESVRALHGIDTAEALGAWVKHELPGVFPHGACLFGLWRVKPAGIVPVKYYAWNCPVDYLDAYIQPNGLYDAAILHGWLGSGEAQLLDAKSITTAPAAAAWQARFRQSGLQNVAVHGVWDYSGHHASCFSFHKIPEPIGAEHRFGLEFLVPHLHGALVRIVHTLRRDRRIIRDPRALTGREREVLGWVCEGKTSTEIAIILGRSVSTVRNQINSILVKLRVNTQAQAAAKAIRKGLVELHGPDSQFGPF